jgi:hypothetical protein
VSENESCKRGIATKEVINDTGSTEIQLEDKHEWWENGQKSCQPRSEDKKGTNLPIHVGGVRQRLADGNITIIGHCSQKKEFRHTMERKKNN